MKITVTQDHIDKGQMSNASVCPIALALNEATGKKSLVTYDRNISNEWTFRFLSNSKYSI